MEGCCLSASMNGESDGDACKEVPLNTWTQIHTRSDRFLAPSPALKHQLERQPLCEQRMQQKHARLGTQTTRQKDTLCPEYNELRGFLYYYCEIMSS